MTLRSLVLVVALVNAASCLTTMNRPKVALRADAPALEPRANGCNVEMLEDGTAPSRPHLDIADVSLEWSRDKIAQQGPEAAMETLRQAACENGAFIVYGIRALSTGSVDAGFIYEATFATLLGDDGKPLNLKGAAAPDAGAPSAPAGP